MRCLRTKVVLFAIAFFIARPLAADDDPSAIVRSFFTRYAGGDLRGAAELWAAGAPADAFVRAHRRRIERRCLRIANLTIAARPDTTVETDETWIMRSGDAEWMETSRSRFTLQQEGTHLRIAKWEPRDENDPRALSRRAVAIVNQGRVSDADELTLRAQRLAERLGDPAAISAALSARSVVARYQHNPDTDVMKELGREAVSFAEAGGDPDVLGRALVRLARAMEDADGVSALEPLERAVALADRFEDPAIASHAATHLARAWEGRARPREGFRYAELASRYAEESDEPAARISSALLLGGAYLWIGEHRVAARHYRRALDVALQAGYDDSAAHSFVSLSIINESGEPDDQLRIIDDGLARVHSERGTTELLRVRAGLNFARGRIDEAERDLQRALATMPAIVTVPSVRLQQAEIERARGHHRAALDLFELARGPNVPFDRGARLGQARVLASLGCADEARRLLEELTSETEAANELVVANPQHELFFSRDQPAHRLLVKLLADQGDLHRALAISERMKATELRAALARGGVEPQWTMSAEEREQEQAIERRIGEISRMLFDGEHSATEVAAMRGALAEARIDLADFQQRLHARRSDVVRAQYPRDIAIDELPAQLDGVTILSFVAGDDETLAFAIGPKTGGRRALTVRRIPIRVTELTKRVARFATLVEQRNLRAAQSGAELYDDLLRPLEPALAGAKLLCVVPDASLWRVPFHVLGPRDGASLIERMPVFYAPSITVLSAAMAKRAERGEARGHGLLALANPAVAAETASLYRALDPEAPVGAIPETESEVRAIARIYGARASRIHIGADAREAILKEEASSYDVLHIASHGIVHDEAPMFSSLLLAPPRRGETEDGLLEAREIARLRLHARLAVLSACDTGRADTTNGRGVIGLTWALLAAGCPTTVVSQWKAQSDVTAKLMVELHRQLAAGASNAEALRRAQLSLRRDRRYRHPFYWAPFVVIGAP